MVLEWVKDQNQEVRKNNLKDNEEDPKEMDVIVEHALSQVGVKNICDSDDDVQIVPPCYEKNNNSKDL